MDPKAAQHPYKDSPLIVPLLDHGVDVNGKGCYRFTVLSCTTFMNTINTARYLISPRADINTQDRLDVTVLNESVENNSHECITLMLDGGADLSIVDYNGETAMHVIARRANLHTLRIFQSADLEIMDWDARSNAGLTARDQFAQRVEVSTDVEKAFQNLMGMLARRVFV